MTEKPDEMKEPIKRTTRSLGSKALGGALRGAIAAPVLLIFLAVFDLIAEMFSRPSMLSLEFFWFVISVLIASAVAGAFLGAISEVFPNRLGVFYSFFPAGGGLAGVVYWVLQRPSTSIAASVFWGAAIAGAIVLIGLIEGQVWREDPTPKEVESVLVPNGPPRKCPKCLQMTQNPDFCEVCGKDIRANPPPLVLPDQTHA